MTDRRLNAEMDSRMWEHFCEESADKSTVANTAIDRIEEIEKKYYQILLNSGVPEEDAEQILELSDLAQEIRAGTADAILQNVKQYGLLTAKNVQKSPASARKFLEQLGNEGESSSG